MPSTSRPHRPLLHPLHGILLAFPVALFAGALLTDIAYLRTAEIQWSNFSSWLIVGALVGGGLTLIWSIVLAIRPARFTGRRRPLLYALLLAIMWIAGFINAFQHSRDAWSSVGTTGLILSIISASFAVAASWVAHAIGREAA